MLNITESSCSKHWIHEKVCKIKRNCHYIIVDLDLVQLHKLNFVKSWNLSWKMFTLRSPKQISTCGTVCYYCFEKCSTFDPNPVLTLRISQRLHNSFQNPFAHIFYLWKQTFWLSFHWILYELILKSLPQLAFIFN